MFVSYIAVMSVAGIRLHQIFIFRIITSRSKTRVGEKRVEYRALVGRPMGKNHSEDPGIDGRTKLK